MWNYFCRYSLKINEIETTKTQMHEFSRQHDNKLNIIRSMATNNGCWSEQFVNPMSTQADNVYQSQAEQYHHVELIIL